MSGLIECDYDLEGFDWDSEWSNLRQPLSERDIDDLRAAHNDDQHTINDVETERDENA